MINEFYFHKKRLRLIRRRKKYVKSRNLLKYRKGDLVKVRKVNTKYKYVYKNQEKALVASECFSLMENPEKVVRYINEVESVLKNKRVGTIFFDLSRIKCIDISAICLLLTKVNKVSLQRVNCYGNLPIDQKSKETITKSGFLDHMKDMNGKQFERDGNNLMIQRGFNKTSNKLLSENIRKAVGHLTGKEDKFRPVFSIAQEMCANSIEHANDIQKNWLFCMYYDVDKVIFTMTDIGLGIIKTLRRKGLPYVEDRVTFKDEIAILQRAFNKKYGSKTEDINRNKGLPKINKCLSDKYIDNLRIITNNVFLDLGNNGSSRKMNISFNGTLYYWELNLNCIERWKNKSLSC